MPELGSLARSCILVTCASSSTRRVDWSGSTLPSDPATTVSTDPVVEALRDLRLDIPEVRAPTCDHRPVIDCGSTEHMLGAFLGTRPA